MYVLGINPGEHEGSACIVKNGNIVAFSESDRITRKKFGTIFKNNTPIGEDPFWVVPTHLVIGQVLHESNLTLDDIDAIAIGWERAQLGWTAKHLGSEKRIGFGNHVTPSDERFDLKKYEEELLPTGLFPRKKTPSIHFVPHHLSHAASAYYMSGFNESAIIVADGWGDMEGVSLFYGSGKEIEKIQSYIESLGHFYGKAAAKAQLDTQSPGKLMGLAPYGVSCKPEIIELTEEGFSFPYNDTNPHEHNTALDFIFNKTKKYVNPHDPTKKLFDNEGHLLPVMHYADFAASVQKEFERVLFHLAKLVKEKTGSSNLVFAGGCGQNCSFNGLFEALQKDVNFFVPPVPQDTGVSLGAALYVERNEHERTKRMEHAYYGYNPAEEEISRVVHKSGLGFKFLEDKKLIEKISQCLVDQKIVGWYNGRAEIGARALGARSLLMDPRNVENWHRMNEVKGREIWRPLAPSILKEHVADFFDVVDSPLADFMVGAFQVKEEAQSIIPACVHVDGSARPQFVNKETNPLYHALISSFYEKTGVPVVMNTSFNLADEPIVHTPQDAILSFIRSDIDVLVLGNYFIEKKAGK